MAEKRNPAIVCCRAVSMLLIVLCHVIGYYTFVPGHNVLGVVLNVGVFSFLAISGYLYGAKTVQNFRDWFRKRYFTVMFPASVLIVLVLAAEFLAGKRNGPFSTAIYLLNLQGLGFLYPRFYRWFSEIEVLGPLWFITVIMLCYTMVPGLQKLRDSRPDRRCGAVCTAVLTAVCVALAAFAGIDLAYFLTFAIGYGLSAKGDLRKLRLRDFAALSALMVVAQVLRLVLRSVCDGTQLYHAYISVSHMVLGLWILCLFFVCSRLLPEQTERIAASRMMTAVDQLSFYVFLTHYCFCAGPLNVYRLADHWILATAGFLLATLAASLALRTFVRFLQRALGV